MHKHNVEMLLGFDFGLRRIGVAVGQTITQSANPLMVLKAKGGIPTWGAIENLLETWSIDAVVVGIPYNMDGTEQEITIAARKFSESLHKHFNMLIHTVDERLTTVEARHLLHTSKPLQSIWNVSVDAYAAKIILESWLKKSS